MDDGESNFLEHEKFLRGLVDDFDFTMPGISESLGKDMAVTAAMAIIERTGPDQKDATGGPIKANEPKYAARKLKKYHSDKVGIRTG
jgi:hypothetical protein